ncbi:hypothetical protein AAC387_Pa07g3409 [Persea americana]
MEILTMKLSTATDQLGFQVQVHREEYLTVMKLIHFVFGFVQDSLVSFWVSLGDKLFFPLQIWAFFSRYLLLAVTIAGDDCMIKAAFGSAMSTESMLFL